MPINNLKISMTEYKRLIEEDSNNAQNSPVYRELLDNLSELAEMMQEYFEYDRDGNAKLLSGNDYNKLIKGYSKLAKSCNNFLAEGHDKNRLEKKRVNMIKQLQGYVGKDLRGLIRADRTKHVTLYDVVKNARIITVDLTGKELKEKGNMQSSRIPLKTSSGIKGFFTKKEVFVFADACRKTLDKYRNLLPNEFSEVLSHTMSDEKLNQLTAPVSEFEFKEEELFTGSEITKTEIYNQLSGFLYNINSSRNIQELNTMLREDKKLAADTFKIYSELFKHSLKNNVMETSYIKNGSRLDHRNSAMSDVASLMGMGDIIAAAKPMQIIHNGEVIEGTFMESAVGDDLANAGPDSLIMQSDKNTFNNPEGLKKLVDMQILDYICGNTDRHAGNMLYQFKKTDDGKVLLTHITGIDNDTSFGEHDFVKSPHYSSNLTHLDSIAVMTQSCFESISNMSADAMRVVLADRLKPEEIDAACKRLSLIRDKLDRKEIEVVNDNDWGKGKNTLEFLAATSGGIFVNVMKDINPIIKNKKEAIERSEKAQKNTVEYADGKDVTNEAEVKFEEIFSKVNNFVSRAKKYSSIFHTNSEEYNNMEAVLTDAQRFGKSIKTKLKEKEEVSIDEFREFAEKVVILGRASQTYINAKNISQYTDLGKDRFALAIEMRDLAQENFTVKDTPVKETAELDAPEEDMQL